MEFPERRSSTTYRAVTEGYALVMKETVYKKYLLKVLLCILAFNYVDRLALGLILQSIKVDLGLSDTQLGFLGGMAFALFYSVMGIPIARWADRGNRVTIISVTAALWSVAVALCGVAATFGQLLGIRVAVAVGEAGCIPPAHSLIADAFNRAERPRAVAQYMLGAPLAVLIGYFVAGWLNQFYGWRTTFILLGLPGIGLAALAWFTLREPRVGKPTTEADRQVDAASVSLGGRARPSSAQPGLRTVFGTLWANATFRHLLLAYSMVSFFGYGILQWQPTFFIRSYGLKTGELGIWFAAIYGLGGVVGTHLGGAMASGRAANNERLQLKGMSVAYIGFGAISAVVYLSTNLYVAFGLLAVTAIGGATTTGPLFATIQTLVPRHMRATSIAVIYLFANFIGMGLGPLAAGALSDALRSLLGEESLRYALLALCPGYLWAGSQLWSASRTVTDDLKAAEGDREGPVALGN